MDKIHGNVPNHIPIKTEGILNITEMNESSASKFEIDIDEIKKLITPESRWAISQNAF